MQPDEFADVVETVVKRALSPLVARVAVIEAQHGTADVNGLRERVAILEARAPLPGPPGSDGPPGPAGKDGADGVNGKDGSPGLRFVGVYVQGKQYDPGDLVTHDGSAWHCGEATTTARPGDGSRIWQLMVKRGKDAKGRTDG